MLRITHRRLLVLDEQRLILNRRVYGEVRKQSVHYDSDEERVSNEH